MVIYVNTTLIDVGDGSFETPYNSLDLALTSRDRIVYVTSDSVIDGPIVLNADAIIGVKLIGFDPDENDEPIESPSDVFPNPGPIVNAFGFPYGITLKKDSGETPPGATLKIINFRIVNYDKSVFDNSLRDMIELESVTHTVEHDGWSTSLKKIELL